MSSYISTPKVTYETAALLVAIVMRLGSQYRFNLVAVVADPAMNVIALGASDGSPPHSVQTGTRKALTSASTRKSTSLMSDALSLTLPLGTGGLLTGIDGGVPLVFDGVHVGGLGVAGGTPEQDAAVALEAIQVMGADAPTADH